MTIKEYLRQAYLVDHRIKSKIEQVVSLRSLVTKAKSTLSKRNTGSMNNIIFKLIELENAVKEEIDTLVDMKSDILAIIKSVKNPEHQILLELRYLCFYSWDQIAVDMGYSKQHIFRLHKQALKNFIKDESKCHRMSHLNVL